MSKIGEIYQINGLEHKRYFQLVASDITQLNSDVIAVLSYKGDLPSKPAAKELNEVTSAGIEFFTHTTVNAGFKDLWTKIGKAKVVDYKDALFKDIYIKDDFPDWEPYEKDHYHSWVIWQVGGKWKKIGAKIDRYPEAELGMVFSPNNIIYRIEHGQYPGVPYYGQVR